MESSRYVYVIDRNYYLQNNGHETGGANVQSAEQSADMHLCPLVALDNAQQLMYHEDFSAERFDTS